MIETRINTNFDPNHPKINLFLNAVPFFRDGQKGTMRHEPIKLECSSCKFYKRNKLATYYIPSLYATALLKRIILDWQTKGI
jgi:hypothetical protein